MYMQYSTQSLWLASHLTYCNYTPIFNMGLVLISYPFKLHQNILDIEELIHEVFLVISLCTILLFLANNPK